jgi:hypothetical protein
MFRDLQIHERLLQSLFFEDIANLQRFRSMIIMTWKLTRQLLIISAL